MSTLAKLHGRGFFALPRQRADWLRLVLTALAAYLAAVEILYALGYEIPLSEHFSAEIVVIVPFALLVAISTAALFFERRLGIVFTLLWLLIVVAAALIPGH